MFFLLTLTYMEVGKPDQSPTIDQPFCYSDVMLRLESIARKLSVSIARLNEIVTVTFPECRDRWTGEIRIGEREFQEIEKLLKRARCATSRCFERNPDFAAVDETRSLVEEIIVSPACHSGDRALE